MKISVNNRSRISRSRIPGKLLVKKIRKLFIDNNAKGELSITFCGDEYMRKLNNQYRRKDKSTDVLSFEFGDKDCIMGDVYISIPTAKRQAKEYNVLLKDELLRLAMHGTLHVLGYNHKEMLALRNPEDVGWGVYGN